MKCKICSRSFNDIPGLSNHIRVHNISSKEYYDQFLKMETEDICNNINCSNKTTYLNMKEGYLKFCSCKCHSNTKKFKEMVKKNHKGKTSPFKGKTYKEIYGEEKAKELKMEKSTTHKNKKVSIETRIK